MCSLTGCPRRLIYTRETANIDKESATQAVSAVLRYLSRVGVVKYTCHSGWQHIEHRYRDIDAFKIYASDTGRLCAKSLRVYMETYHPAYAVKLSAKNFGMEDNKKLYRCTRHFACDNRTPWQNLYAGALAAWLPATFFLSFQKMVVK